jgi:hypothetical protein
MDFIDQINDFIEYEESDFKFKIGQDKIVKLNLDFTPTIAYDYLNLNDDLDYSFHHPEFLEATSEEYPEKSDYSIYFEKIKKLCLNTIDDSLNNSHYTEHLKTISPNKKLLDVVKKIFKVSSIRDEQLPQFGELGLYTNKKGKKSPRIFFFIGNLGIIYILFYDPFHSIFNKNK